MVTMEVRVEIGVLAIRDGDLFALADHIALQCGDGAAADGQRVASL